MPSAIPTKNRTFKDTRYRLSPNALLIWIALFKNKNAILVTIILKSNYYP